MDEIALRALMPQDAGAARALVVNQFGRTRYESRVLEQLDAALAFEDPEYMAMLALAPASDEVVGLMLFGTVAGARGVVKVHVVLGDDVATRERLIAAVQNVAQDSGERMIVAEMAEDAPSLDAVEALRACGFIEEGRIADFVCDGVALRLLVWRPAAV